MHKNQTIDMSSSFLLHRFGAEQAMAMAMAMPEHRKMARELGAPNVCFLRRLSPVGAISRLLASALSAAVAFASAASRAEDTPQVFQVFEHIPKGWNHGWWPYSNGIQTVVCFSGTQKGAGVAWDPLANQSREVQSCLHPDASTWRAVGQFVGTEYPDHPNSIFGDSSITIQPSAADSPNYSSPYELISPGGTQKFFVIEKLQKPETFSKWGDGDNSEQLREIYSEHEPIILITLSNNVALLYVDTEFVELSAIPTGKILAVDRDIYFIPGELMDKAIGGRTTLHQRYAAMLHLISPANRHMQIQAKHVDVSRLPTAKPSRPKPLSP